MNFVLTACLNWKRRLGYAWHQLKVKRTYWIVECPDQPSGFVSFGDWQAVTHFARYYLNAGDKSLIRRRWNLGRISLSRVRQMAERYGLVAIADGLASPALKAGTLAWPSLVELVIDLPSSVEEYRKSLAWSAKSDLNRIRRYGLTMKVSRDPERLKEFYYRYFLPSVIGRHGQDAYMLSFESCMAFFKEGRDCELIEAWSEGVWVGGIISETDGRGVRSRRIGWLNGDETYRREGVLGALHWFAITRAIERGQSKFIFGGAAPYLEDGLIHAKSKWKARLSCELSHYAPWRVMLAPTHQDCQSFFDRHSLLLKYEPTNQFDVISGRRQEEVKQATSKVEQLHEWRLLDDLIEREANCA